MDSNQTRLINSIAKADFLPDNYDEKYSGPVKPGFYFFKWLTKDASLPISIPETLLIEDSKITRLYNDPKTNCITSQSMYVGVAVECENALISYCEACTTFAEPSRHDTRTLDEDVVAVRKRPTWNQSLATNNTEILNPRGLQARVIQTTSAFTVEPCVLQRYVRSKGKTAGLHRIIWRAQGSGASVGWKISNTTPINENEKSLFANFNIADVRDQEISVDVSDDANPQQQTFRINKRKKTLTESRNDYVYQLRNSGLSLAEQHTVGALSNAHELNRVVGSQYLCSLTTSTGAASPDVQATKMSNTSRKSLEEQANIFVQWFQRVIQRKEDVIIRFQSVVLDFIKDENDPQKWWFIQVKGFKIADESIDRIQIWCYRQSGKRHNEQVGLNTTSLTAQAVNSEEQLSWKKLMHDPYAMSSKERKKKLEQERGGDNCRCCGKYFVTNQMVTSYFMNKAENEVKDDVKKSLFVNEHPTPAHPSPKGNSAGDCSPSSQGTASVHGGQIPHSFSANASIAATPSKRALRSAVSGHNSVAGTPAKPRSSVSGLPAVPPLVAKEVPIFGYYATISAAYEYVQALTKIGAPETKQSRDIVQQYTLHCQFMNAIERNKRPKNPLLSRVEEESFSMNFFVGKELTTSVVCCYYCFQVIEENEKHLKVANRLNRVLGADMMTTSKKIGSEKSKKTGNIMYQYSHLKRKDEMSLWRLLFMAHFITDIDTYCYNSHTTSYSAVTQLDDLWKDGNIGVLSYSLGNQVVHMEFTIHVSMANKGAYAYGGSDVEPVVWIRQCRLHHMVCPASACKAMFRAKRIDITLSIYKPNSVAVSQSYASFSSPGLLHSGEKSRTALYSTNFELSLHKLMFTGESDATGATEKIDLFIPIQLPNPTIVPNHHNSSRDVSAVQHQSVNTPSPIVLKFSIAVTKDELDETAFRNTEFTFDHGIYWPLSKYIDVIPLPSSWLSMLIVAEPTTVKKLHWADDSEETLLPHEATCGHSSHTGHHKTPAHEPTHIISDTDMSNVLIVLCRCFRDHLRSEHPTLEESDLELVDLSKASVNTYKFIDRILQYLHNNKASAATASGDVSVTSGGIDNNELSVKTVHNVMLGVEQILLDKDGVLDTYITWDLFKEALCQQIRRLGMVASASKKFSSYFPRNSDEGPQDSGGVGYTSVVPASEGGMTYLGNRLSREVAVVRSSLNLEEGKLPDKPQESLALPKGGEMEEEEEQYGHSVDTTEDEGGGVELSSRRMAKIIAHKVSILAPQVQQHLMESGLPPAFLVEEDVGDDEPVRNPYPSHTVKKSVAEPKKAEVSEYDFEDEQDVEDNTAMDDLHGVKLRDEGIPPLAPTALESNTKVKKKAGNVGAALRLMKAPSKALLNKKLHQHADDAEGTNGTDYDEDTEQNSSLSAIARKNQSMLDALLSNMSSSCRTTRRLSIFQSIFEIVSQRSQMVDIVSLRRFFIKEQEKLHQFVALVKDRNMTVPPISRHYQSTNKSGSNFSLVRSVTCSLLLSSSVKLRQLFRMYTKQGQSCMNEVGFMAVAEECFQRLTNAGPSHHTRSPGNAVGVDANKEFETDLGYARTKVQEIAYDPVLREFLQCCQLPSDFIPKNGPPSALHTKFNSNLPSSILRDTSIYEKYIVYLHCDCHGGPCCFFLHDLCCCRCELEYQKVES